ncbi:hypothetical protein IAT38_008200 [Cryptococcus sp. DSM 104549]
MSTKRPRAPDTDERDNKRVKGTPSVGEVETKISEQIAKVGKLYNEVLIQAALIFRHQSLARRLGLKERRVPGHMTQRLELSWRAYEGLRKQVEWEPTDDPQIKPLPPLPLPKSTTLAATIASLVTPFPSKSTTTPRAPQTVPTPAPSISPTTSIHPKSIPMPMPGHLTGGPGGIPGQAQAVSSPIPLGAASSLAFSGQALQEAQPIIPPLPDLPELPEMTPSGASQTSQSFQPQPQLSQPQPQQEQQEQPQQQPMQEVAPMDYSSLGLEELEMMINGDTSDIGLSLGLGGGSGGNAGGAAQSQSGQEQQGAQQQGQGQEQVQGLPDFGGLENVGQHQQEVIDLTLDDAPASLPQPEQGQQPQQDVQSMADDVFASLGLSTDLSQSQVPPPPTDQPQATSQVDNQSSQPEAQLGQAQNEQPQPTPALDFNFSTGGGGEHDFSALAGLFAGASGGSDLSGGGANLGGASGSGGAGAGDGKEDPLSALMAATAGGNLGDDQLGGLGGGDNGFGDLGAIDMSDFNFGGDSAPIDGDEFERLMAEFN